MPRAALGQSGKPRRGPHLGRPPASSSCCRSGDCGPDHCARTCQPDQGAWVGSAARPRRAPAVGSAAAGRGARGGASAERPRRSQHTPAAPSGRPPAIWRAPTCCRARGTRARQGPLRCGARGRVAGAPRLQRKGAAGGTLGLRSYRHCREVVPPAPAAGARLQQERERCQHQRQRDQELGSPARQERRRDPRALHRRSRGCPRRASPARHHHRAAKAPPRRSAPLPAPLWRVPLSTRTPSPAAHRTGAVRAPWQLERAVRSAHRAAPAALSCCPAETPCKHRPNFGLQSTVRAASLAARSGSRARRCLRGASRRCSAPSSRSGPAARAGRASSLRAPRKGRPAAATPPTTGAAAERTRSVRVGLEPRASARGESQAGEPGAAPRQGL